MQDGSINKYNNDINTHITIQYSILYTPFENANTSESFFDRSEILRVDR